MKKSLTHLVIVVALGLSVAACSDSLTNVNDEADAASISAVESSQVASKKPGSLDIVSLASTQDTLSTLVEVVLYSDANCATDFAATLSSPDYQFTVFAPTNKAFADAITLLGEATVLSCDVLPVVLSYHVTKGRHWSRNVLAHKRFRMLSGEFAPVDANALTIAGAPLDATLLDISASNGMVHVIDAVMIPPSIAP